MHGKHYQPDKDDLGYNQDQRNLSESEEIDKRKESIIKDTIQEYFLDPEGLCERLYELDKEYYQNAKNMYEALCDIYNVFKVQCAFELSSITFQESDKTLLGIKALVFRAMYSVYDVPVIDKLKLQYLHK